MLRISGAVRSTSAVLCAVVATTLVSGLFVGPVAAAEPAAVGAATGAVNEIRIFGTSVKGRALRAYRIGDPASEQKVVIISTMHGDEQGTLRILKTLINGRVVTGADIWLVPYLNRDGLARGTRKNARGVDLNRNFPVSWQRQTGKYNSGPRPASEPETRALMRFLTNVSPDQVISLHQPLRGVDTSYGKARSLALKLVQGLRLPAKVFNCNGGCHGTMTQWFNRRFPGAALTVEYGYRVSAEQVYRTGPTGLLSAVGASR